MKKNKILLFSVFMLVLVVANVIFAATDSVIDTTKTGTLTILTREQSNGSTETTTAPVISGIEYTLYKVGDVGDTTISTLEQAETAIASLTAVGTQTTGSDGKTIFTNLALGRYYAKVTGYPTGTSKIPDSFLVDIPMTNEAGDAWVYEVVADPKVQTASGTVHLVVSDVLNAKFKIQISTKNADSTWSDWSDYIPEGSTTVAEVTGTDIEISNIPITFQQKEARYRFYLLEAGYDSNGCVIDDTELDYVYVQDDGKTVVVHSDGTQEEAADVSYMYITIGESSIYKTIQHDDGNYRTFASVGVSDVIKYRIETTVPHNVAKLDTYTITDTFGAAITNGRNIVVIGILSEDDSEVTLTQDNEYTLTQTSDTMTLVFDTSKLDGYGWLLIEYDASLDVKNATLGSAGEEDPNNTNTCTLTATKNVETKETVQLSHSTYFVTGGVKILKTDSSDNPLAGAQFKIAATEADAKAGNFLKGTDGQDLVATSGTDGYAVINGIAYNDLGGLYTPADVISWQKKDYYLVEVQAPTYTETTDEGTVTKTYKLLKEPLKVTVTGFSHEDENAVQIVNRKPLELPKTGGIGIAIFALVGIGVMTYSIRANKKAKNMEA